MRTNHLDARALTQPGGAFDSLADSLGQSMSAYFQHQNESRRSDREMKREERQMRRQQLAEALARAERYDVAPTADEIGWTNPEDDQAIQAARTLGLRMRKRQEDADALGDEYKRKVMGNMDRDNARADAEAFSRQAGAWADRVGAVGKFLAEGAGFGGGKGGGEQRRGRASNNIHQIPMRNESGEVIGIKLVETYTGADGRTYVRELGKEPEPARVEGMRYDQNGKLMGYDQPIGPPLPPVQKLPGPEVPAPAAGGGIPWRPGVRDAARKVADVAGAAVRVPVDAFNYLTDGNTWMRRDENSVLPGIVGDGIDAGRSSLRDAARYDASRVAGMEADRQRQEAALAAMLAPKQVPWQEPPPIDPMEVLQARALARTGVPVTVPVPSGGPQAVRLAQGQDARVPDIRRPVPATPARAPRAQTVTSTQMRQMAEASNVDDADMLTMLGQLGVRVVPDAAMVRR